MPSFYLELIKKFEYVWVFRIQNYIFELQCLNMSAKIVSIQFCDMNYIFVLRYLRDNLWNILEKQSVHRWEKYGERMALAIFDVTRARISVSSYNIVLGHRAHNISTASRGKIYESSRDEFGIQLSTRCCPMGMDPLRASCFVSKGSRVWCVPEDGLNQKEYLHR